MDNTKKEILEHLSIALQPASDEPIEKKDTQFEGIEQYLAITGSCMGDRSGYTKVHKSFLEYFNIDKEEAWDRAYKNLCSAVRIKNLGEFLYGTLSDIPKEPIYMVTTDTGVHGAAAILDSEKMAELANTLHTNSFIVVPASIHEMLVMPKGDARDIEEISDFVKQVNANELSPEEVLSDRAYYLNL